MLSCPGVDYVVPLVTWCCCSVLLAGAVGSAARSASKAQGTRSVALYVQLAGMAINTLPILSSHDISLVLGKTKAWSGFMLGAYAMGMGMGQVSMWLVMRRWHDVWRMWPRALRICALLTNLAGTLLFIRAAHAAATRNSLRTHSEQAPALAAVVVTSRILSGIAQGVCAQLNQVSFARLTPDAERPSQMAWFFLANMVGKGLGPLMASVTEMMRICQAGPRGFETVGFMQVAVALGALVAVVAFQPCLAGAQDFSSAGLAITVRDRVGSPRKIIILSACLAMTLTRSAVVSGVEVATALLLEIRFGWTAAPIGGVIGATFLLSIPLKLTHWTLANRMPVTLWITLLSSIALFGSLLLFDWASMLFGGGDKVLIIADMLLFPTIYLSDGLINGVMQQHCLPDGSCFDVNHVTLWAGIASNGVGLFLGPWVARWCVQVGSQNLYALWEFMLSLLFLLIFRFVVEPLVRTSRQQSRVGLLAYCADSRTVSGVLIALSFVTFCICIVFSRSLSSHNVSEPFKVLS